MGYAFVNVSPRIKKFGDNKVELTFEIEEGTKIFIDRINITGNVKTNDSVIRENFNLLREMHIICQKLKKVREE